MALAILGPVAIPSFYSEFQAHQMTGILTMAVCRLLRSLRPALVPLLLLAPVALAAQGPAYAPCLGCVEHNEIRDRWHQPFLATVAGEAVVMGDHYRLEAQARDLGLCETDALIRAPQAVNGCHPFSMRRALLLETPLEVVAFTSPAWGLGRAGHPRWALALEFVPMTYHALAIRGTTQAIHRWQRLEFLLQ